MGVSANVWKKTAAVSSKRAKLRPKHSWIIFVIPPFAIKKKEKKAKNDSHLS